VIDVSRDGLISRQWVGSRAIITYTRQAVHTTRARPRE
jgi:hypothetical protein